MAENLLSDARVRSASLERDGPYLPDGGGLRIRLLPPSPSNPRGVKLAEFHFKVKVSEEWRHGALHLGTLGAPVVDAEGRSRPFTLADARRARNAARDLVARGIDPREARRLADREAAETQRQRLAHLDGRRLVRQAFRDWHRIKVAPHHKDEGAGVQGLFDRHILPAIGDKPLDEWRRADVVAILDTLTAAGKKRTANIALQLMRQFASWCVASEWIAADPTATLERKDAGGRERPRSRTLTPAEITELRDKLPAARLQPRIVHAVWLLLATTARVGELSAARVSDFDLDARTWRIPETKSGEPHLVHLSDFALVHVRALLALRGESAYLLPTRAPGSDDDEDDDRPLRHYAIGKMLRDRQRDEALAGRTTAAATLTLAGGEWTPHDLRRTAASRMRDLGVPSDVIERCLNHKPQGIVAVYQTGELLPERKAAFEAWGRELMHLATTELQRTALHEAGHTVAHSRLGLDHDGARIIGGEGMLGAAAGEGASDVWNKEQAGPVVIAYCAGYAALVAAGYSEKVASKGCGSDFERAEEVINFWKLEGDLANWQRKAVELLREPRNLAAVERVAEELLAHELLPGEYVDCLLELVDGITTQAEFDRYVQRSHVLEYAKQAREMALAQEA